MSIEQEDPNGKPATIPSDSAGSAAALTWLDPQRLRFFQSGATLNMTIEGDCTHLNVGVFRAFPLTHPRRFYSVRGSGGKEIGLIASPSALSSGDLRLVEGDLQRRYLVTSIHRVLGTAERFGTVDWQVETSRGTCRFTTRDPRNHVLCPEPGRYLLTDVDGNRYEVTSLDALDPQSRALLLRHL